MRTLAFTAALGALTLGLAACSTETANNAASGDGAEAPATNGGSAATASASWPSGARIVVEDGVTYRIDRDGTRVRLAEGDARIVVENGVRYRVDPAGTRVRIDDSGLDVDVDLPDVDVGINEKGNPDVDVTPNR